MRSIAYNRSANLWVLSGNDFAPVSFRIKRKGSDGYQVFNLAGILCGGFTARSAREAFAMYCVL